MLESIKDKDVLKKESLDDVIPSDELAEFLIIEIETFVSGYIEGVNEFNSLDAIKGEISRRG